jgi:hypothetical protein
MLYSDKFYFICRVPLSAEGPEDVEVITKAETMEDFPRVFVQYEELRSHAFNKDGLFSVVRADEIYALVRTNNPKEAKILAFEDSRSNLITNLEHRVMQNKDKEARAILKNVHEVELPV